jgi:hypothetical protein
MDPVSGQNILPVSAVDRLIGSYAGGMNTDVYYQQTYGQTPQPQQHTSYVEVNEEGIPIVYINGQATPPTATVTQPGLTTQTSQTTQVTGKKSYDVLTPTGFATTVINAVFSIAVIIAIIMGFVVVYLIIRTKQLHHHEEHVRGVLHGDSHGGTGHGHAAPTADHAAASPAHGATAHETEHVPHNEHPTDDQALEPEGVAGDEAYVEATMAGLESSEHDVFEDEDEGESGATQKQDANDAVADVVMDDGLSAETRGDTSNSAVSERFRVVREYAAGDDAAEWRHALMDIDLILEDLLAKKGIPGNSTSERLANTDSTQLQTLQDALAAHAYYEQLVDDEDEDLSKASLQKLITMYGPVFAEFGLY